MADFDLSQALGTNSVETPLDSCYCDAEDTEDPNFPFDAQIVISCNHNTMKRVANLVVAINRMKKPMIEFGHGLSGSQLCNVVFETLIKAKPVEMLESNVGKRVYQRVNSVNQCTLCDVAQKDLVHISGGLKLYAITLKGGNSDHKVQFQMSRYITGDSAVKGQPVILSITKCNLHLSCSMENETAVLKIEQCSETDLKKISSEKNMDRFLFTGTIKGISETKFESVNCPGWYISTSSEDENLPVEMCQVDTANRLICFKINRS